MVDNGLDFDNTDGIRWRGCRGHRGGVGDVSRECLDLKIDWHEKGCNK